MRCSYFWSAYALAKQTMPHDFGSCHASNRSRDILSGCSYDFKELAEMRTRQRSL
jgi:hypothetical protein